MDDFRVERFDSKLHQRGAFDCGNQDLNEFLHRLVTQYEKRRLGRTYVATRPAEPSIVVGFYTLAAGSLEYKNMPEVAARKLPRHHIPAILLGRLAVDLSCQRHGLGTRLIVDATERALNISNIAGVFGLEVLADGEGAVAFYTKFGFSALLDNPQHMYLPFGTVEEAVLRTLPPDRFG